MGDDAVKTLGALGIATNNQTIARAPKDTHNLDIQETIFLPPCD